MRNTISFVFRANTNVSAGLLWVDSTNSAHAIAVTRSAPDFGDRFDVQSGPTRMISSMTTFGWEQPLALLS